MSYQDALVDGAGSYPTAEMKFVYSAAQAYWAMTAASK